MWRDLFQPSHLIIVAVLLVILFGWKKLPDAARSVGRSMRIFKSEVSEMKNDGKDARPSAAASDTTSMISAHFKRDMGSPFGQSNAQTPALVPGRRSALLRRRSKAERGAASACRASQARPSGGDGDPPGGTTTPRDRFADIRRDAG